MADDAFSTKKLLSLRRLTRAVADLMRGQIKEYLSILSVQLRPKPFFGEFMDGAKDFVKGADANYKEMAAAFEKLCSSKPYTSVAKDIKTPLVFASHAADVQPLEYVHEAKADGQTKSIVVTAPLTFVLSYAGFAPKRLKELLAGQGSLSDTQEFLLHTLMLNVVLARQPALARLFEAVRFPLTTGKIPGCGDLPFAFLTAAVPTLLPPDDVIIENTEISGTNAFEEVIDLQALSAMKDPFKDKLIELAGQHGETIS